MLNAILKSPVHSLKENELLYSLLGVVLLILTSQISIPLEPVPITLQTFGVLLLGLTFERTVAIKSIMTYLCLGAIGFPVFSEFSGGFAVFLGPTGGYLIGFLMAVILMTTLTKLLIVNRFWQLLLISLLGSIVIYSFGILWLTRFMGLNQAMMLGFVPFIIPGVVKMFLLSVVLKYCNFQNG